MNALPLRHGGARSRSLGASSRSGKPLPTAQGQANSALWLHLHLPLLALEAMTRGVTDDLPRVVVQSGQRRAVVLCCNHRAAALGIRPDLPLGAAHALGEFDLVERNPRAEERALRQLCVWATQFSPQVSVEGEDGLVLEIRGSLRLFGGFDALLRRVRRGLRELGYHADYAVAPTPGAAGLLARTRPREVITETCQLTTRLAGLPLAALRLPSSWHDALAQLGARNLGDCRRLPRGGLARRFAPELIDQLDRLFGLSPDPRPAFALPNRFEGVVDLPWEVDNARGLMLAVERLVCELVAFLNARQVLARRLRWSLLGRGGHRACLPLELARPGRDAGHLLLLMRELLARRQLAVPAHAVLLEVDDLVAAGTPRCDDLFGARDAAQGEAYAAFVDRLRTRYGEAVLRSLRMLALHHPVQASRRVPAVVRHQGAPHSLAHNVARLAPRPLWLLHQPVRLHLRHGQPVFHGLLQLASERERIQNAWWGEERLDRDYFIACHPRGDRLWIYRELDGARQWYLHGIFE